MSELSSSINAIDPFAQIGLVTIRVSSLAMSEEFYAGSLGFTVAERAPGRLLMGADGDLPFLELVELPGAKRKPRGMTGLFHFAILVPTRYDLGRALRRLIASKWPLTGASDHMVSEALYLDDRDGNGIEIYRDRPRSEWIVRDGLYAMVSDQLDIDGVYEEAADVGDNPGVLAVGTRMGHVHVQVANLEDARRFYVDGLGLEIVAKYPSALFIAAGNYHHHVGLNTWGTVGGSKPPPDSVGLIRFEVTVSSPEELARIADRLQAMDVPFQLDGDALTAAEPSGGQLRVSVASGV